MAEVTPRAIDPYHLQGDAHRQAYRCRAYETEDISIHLSDRQPHLRQRTPDTERHNSYYSQDVQQTAGDSPVRNSRDIGQTTDQADQPH
jgi:hypothetical protein